MSKAVPLKKMNLQRQTTSGRPGSAVSDFWDGYKTNQLLKSKWGFSKLVQKHTNQEYANIFKQGHIYTKEEIRSSVTDGIGLIQGGMAIAPEFN